MIRRAECCCGGLIVQVSGSPQLSAVCHCSDCKERTGSAFGWSTYFPSDAFKIIKGDARTYKPSGDDRQIRYFCGSCGSTVYWTVSDRPGSVGVAGGSLTPALPAPTGSFQDRDRHDWVQLPGGCISNG